MTAYTPNMGLPLLDAAQDQPEVIINQALQILDVITQLTVISATSTQPVGSPTEPADGTAYIVPNLGAGVFAGHDHQVAYYAAGWKFITPKIGWKAYVQDSATTKTYTGGSPSGWA